MIEIIQRHINQPLDNIEWKNIHPVLQRIYAARGIQTPQEIEHDLAKLLSYQTLKNIDAAVDLLIATIVQQQKILIIGDFDADGATSTVVAVRILRAFGAEQVDYLVPNRFTYGYGLTPEIVEVAAKKNPHLIITVDNGISSVEGVQAAKNLGIKVLITDHHIAGDSLPKADAIINPNQKDDEFPSKSIAGVGVIFYVMLALRSRLREINWFVEKNIAEPNLAEYLDLVALGTVADVVALDHNNRILVQQGLRRIRAGKCVVGIKALLEVAKRNIATLQANDLGFSVGPRLNAAGRLEDMALGIECLLTENAERAIAIAQQLDALNHERRNIEGDMSSQAFAILKKLDLTDVPVGLCLFDESWHQGVIGILASRIKDKYHRPTIAFAPINETEIKGSARSISGVHIRDVLDAIAKTHPNLLTKFGGHAMAAGLSLEKQALPAFKLAFAAEVGKHVNADELRGKLYSDGKLASNEMTLEFADQLLVAGPWGQAFPEPMFDGEFNIIEQHIVGQKHLKLVLQRDGIVYSAIAFNIDLQHWPNHRCQTIHAVYRLDINEFRDRRSVQLIVEHLIPLAN